MAKPSIVKAFSVLAVVALSVGMLAVAQTVWSDWSAVRGGDPTWMTYIAYCGSFNYVALGF